MSRIDDLVAAMTLDEKIGQLTMISLGAETIVTGPGATREPSIAELREGRLGSVLNLVGRDRIHALQKIAVEDTRLGIPLLFALDVIHGYRTCFPVPLGETAAFRPDLWEKTARFAAEEATEDALALTFTPMLDLARDPRWGRIVEGPGEDPHVGAVYARAKVRGFQTDDLARPDALAATAKHFVAYGAVTAGRDYASVDISERTLHEVYLPAFRAAVDAGCAAIMPAFVDLAGRPMSGDRALLTDLVRSTWGFEGIHVSDYDAVGELVAHGVAGDMVEAAALALNAGMDLDMMSPAYPQGLKTALERGLTDLATLDATVRRVLALKERLGLFDAPFGRGDPARPSARSRAERRALAREAAAASMVLLDNCDAILPLAATGGPIALIGPFAEAAFDMMGPWYGLGDQEETIDLAQGLRAAFRDREILVAAGVERDGDDVSGIAAAVAVAAQSDVVLLAVGEPAGLSGEAASRVRPGLTGRQAELARAVVATGRPVVVLLTCGRPLIEPWLYDAAAATLVLWYPGGEAGHAVGDLLAGRRSPSGRLPVSWPRDVGQIPLHYGERPTGRPFLDGEHFTTRYIDSPNDPQFPFGAGLGYGSIDIGKPRPATDRLIAGESLTVAIDLAHAGGMACETPIFVFLHDRVASTSRPVLELKHFEVVGLMPGETRTLTVTLPPAAFACLGPDLEPRIEPGLFDVLVGPSADRRTLKGAVVEVGTAPVA
ncbi:beta-glucosidase [Siculibacillus lacustris]|uniref:beta-glucosidase n=1 Tax=Siculibacillus lacustris TaxID=1549641 RepID=A0A4Q9VLT9_9HYPH|nr:glycoside hydrolase family 3 N-terminal domain-containing protein [Siculibacillus lacustris]TBW36467.1 beta-glucosidase [Siculibacillus lacustris]